MIKKILVITAFMVLIASAVFASDDGAKSSTSTAEKYNPATTTAAPSFRPSAGYGYWTHPVDSKGGKFVLLSTLLYFNYEMIADKRTTAAMIMDGGAVAGLITIFITYRLVAGDGTDSPNAAVYTPAILSSLCMTGLICYPFYSLIDSYIRKDYRNTARGWIGYGITMMDYIIIAGDKYVPGEEKNVSFTTVFGDKKAMIFICARI